ncbi:MAG: hypothetical protein IPN48_08065 [Sphingomonadales bacterium]|nr:hypothetical protein [Sphingomonadales bacterium]
MNNANTEEVKLDMEAEAEDEVKPEPQPAEPNIDPATQAFARLEGEMALVRRAVERLAAERADIVMPDYGATLTDMTKQFAAISESLEDIAEHPAMRLTPERLGARIEAVAVAARRAAHARIDQASKEARQAAHDMKAAITQVSTAAYQRRRLWQGIGGGALAGILLWSFLPGTIARAVPEDWHWPERMAARMVGESSRWDAGTRLMRSESLQAWNALVQAADMLRDNREAIETCQKTAANAKQPVRCTVRIRAGSKPRN